MGRRGGEQSCPCGNVTACRANLRQLRPAPCEVENRAEPLSLASGQVLACLAAGGVYSVEQIAAATGLTHEAAGRSLSKLVKRGRIYGRHWGMFPGVYSEQPIPDSAVPGLTSGQDRNSEIVRLWREEGKTAAQIAEIVGVSAELARVYISRAKVTAALALHEEGLTLAQIGERLGVSTATVSRHLREQGIEGGQGQYAGPRGPQRAAASN